VSGEDVLSSDREDRGRVDSNPISAKKGATGHPRLTVISTMFTRPKNPPLSSCELWFYPCPWTTWKKIMWFAGCTLCLPWTLHLNLCYHRHHQNIPGDHVVDAIGWKTCQTFFLRSPSLRHHPLVLVYAAVRSPGDLCWVSIW
jgi:hypothetical protein